MRCACAARAAALRSPESPTPFFTPSQSFSATRSPSSPAALRAHKTRVVVEALTTHVRALPDTDILIRLKIQVYQMTLIQRVHEGNSQRMEPREDNEKPSRPVRNKRHTRRCLIAGQRPQKRLFTPEIKRYLKDWLVRRRENPYPNREEKKQLSRETGLTYIQICNWFANWRRKLKNANSDRNQLTWGHLIRTYNDRAQGNVEQFSICSDDSIWSEPEFTQNEETNINRLEEDFQPSKDSYDTDGSSSSLETFQSFNNNYNEVEQCEKGENKTINSPILLSKWLESAARFQPSEKNYSWWVEEAKAKKNDTKVHKIIASSIRHDRDEVEAAVALTALASATHGLTAS